MEESEKNKMAKTAVIIVAGGKGTRMGLNIKKQYIKLNHKEVLVHTIEKFNEMEEIDDIIVVVSEEDIAFVKKDLCEHYGLSKVSKVIAGGKERQDSVKNGLKCIEDTYEFVIVHDGARPLIKQETIHECLEKAKETGACIVAVPVKDTIKICNPQNGRVVDTPDRATLWAVQTPQIFKKNIIDRAYAYAEEKKILGTDDSMLVEAIKEPVYKVEGAYTNIKITTKEDIILAENLMGK